MFYKFALSFSSILHQFQLIATTPDVADVREQLCLMFTDLLALVVDVAITFYRAVKGMSASSVSIDIFETFGDTIEGFRSRRDKIVEMIWSYQIGIEGAEEGRQYTHPCNEQRLPAQRSTSKRSADGWHPRIAYFQPLAEIILSFPRTRQSSLAFGSKKICPDFWAARINLFLLQANREAERPRWRGL